MCLDRVRRIEEALWSGCRLGSGNGLLRQYLPRNSRLGDRTQAELDAIADEFNGRLDKPSAG